MNVTYLLVVLVVVSVNLMPVLGPPTWLVLVLFRLHQHLDVTLLVVLGAVGAAAGRWLLALATRRLADHLPAARRDNLVAAGELLRRKRSHAAVAGAVFLLSPLPSAQLFEAAGLMRLALRPLTVAFFCGRLVSYSAYVGAAAVAEQSLGSALQDSLVSWPSIVLQVGLLLGVLALGRVDWAARLVPVRPAGS